MRASVIAPRVAAILAFVFACMGPVRDASAGGTSRLSIFTRSGIYVFLVEEALTEAERERGLMNRKTMAPDHGMIFVFPSSGPVSFWMKDTLIPLDMLFVRADGTVAGVVANAEPLSERIIPSPGPVRFVIELDGGRAAEIDARPGDRVENHLIR